MDCEMVGVGETGQTSVLARVSIVNNYGNCVYDKFVKAKETVTDYRTAVSGVRPQDMKNGLQVTFVIVMQLYICTRHEICVVSFQEKI